MPRIVDHDRRREQLARLAVEVVQQRGAEYATVRRIARAGGFSIGVLTHYFRDKDELIGFAFRWAARQSFAELDALLATHPPGLARVRAALEFMLPAASGPSFIQLWLSLWGGAVRNAELARVHREYYARWRRTLRRCLREAAQRRQIRTPGSLGDTIDLLTAAVDGLWIGAQFEAPHFPPARRRRLVGALLAALLERRPR